MTKVGRNDPCPCGSGKKYKKCCETKQHHGRLTAERVTTQTPKATGLTSLFQANTQAIPVRKCLKI